MATLSRFTSTPLAVAISAALSLGISPIASAAAVGLGETEDNDVFADRNDFGVGPGEHLVNGNLFEGDVDFLSFSGLTPGNFWTAGTRELDGNGFDSVLGTFDATGALLASNDSGPDTNDGASGDGAEGYSLLGGIVGSTGEVHLAVSGFDDFDFDGESDTYGGRVHDQFADYELLFDSFAISSPGPRLGDTVVLPDGDTFLCGGVVEGFCFGELEVEDGKVVTLDPPMTEGWDFDIVGGSGAFATAQFPAVGADTLYELIVGGTSYMITAGDVFDFLAETGGNPTTFMLRGIDPAENLNSDNPLAFPVTFGFTPGASSPTVLWTPFSSTGVPEPGTLALAVSAAGLGWLAMRRRRRPLLA